MAKWYDPTEFNPFDWDDEEEPPEDFDGDITDFDQLFEFDSYDDADLEYYEFHGTGDT